MTFSLCMPLRLLDLMANLLILHTMMGYYRNGMVKKIQQFFATGQLNPTQNQTFIALISKVQNPIMANDYRLITFVVLIIISLHKFLLRVKENSDGLHFPLPNRIHPRQMDCREYFECTKNTMHHLEKNEKRSLIGIKLDLKKAYDMIEYDSFLCNQ